MRIITYLHRLLTAAGRAGKIIGDIWELALFNVGEKSLRYETA